MEYRITGRTTGTGNVLNRTGRKIAGIRESFSALLQNWKKETRDIQALYCMQETGSPDDEEKAARARADLEFEAAAQFWELT